MLDKLLTPEEVAKVVRVSVKTLANWRTAGIGPPVFRFRGSPPQYPEAAFEKWILQHTEQMNGTQKAKAAIPSLPPVKRRLSRVAGSRRLGGYRTQSDIRRELIEKDGPFALAQGQKLQPPTEKK